MTRTATSMRPWSFGWCLTIGLLAVTPAATPFQAASPPETGVVQGHVRLSSAAPANPVIRMGADPACSQLYATERPAQEFVVRSVDGGLANAFVRVRGEFPQAPPPPSQPVVLEQRGCVYRPHVVGIRVGQRLEVRNLDPTSHNVHSLSTHGNQFNVTQLRSGPPVNFTMKHDELMLRITCDVHSWMNIFVGVMRHPYFAVSGADGRFTIAGVPVGRQTVEVWHERYGPLSTTVTVDAIRPAAAEFTYTGNERPAAPTAVLTVPSAPFAVRVQ